MLRYLAILAGIGVTAPAASQIVVGSDGSGGLVLANVLPTEAAAKPKTAGSGGHRVTHRAKVPRANAPALAGRHERLDALVAAAAARHDLPEALLNAVIQAESNFNPLAVSAKGATGPMQLMPGTARSLGVRDIRDPAANIDGGAKYLKELLARFDNDLPNALAAYNAGPGAVTRSGGIPAYAETRQYVPKVVGYYHAFQTGRADSPH